jgi:hypothetical protein
MVKADIRPAEVIGEDEEKVGPIRRSGSTAKDAKQANDEGDCFHGGRENHL